MKFHGNVLKIMLKVLSIMINFLDEYVISELELEEINDINSENMD